MDKHKPHNRRKVRAEQALLEADCHSPHAGHKKAAIEMARGMGLDDSTIEKMLDVQLPAMPDKKNLHTIEQPNLKPKG